MGSEDLSGKDWSDQEIDLIVSDYFDMLEMELSGKPYVKSQRNKALQDMTGRSRGSIEFKHQNISAALHQLGMPWISGYKPMANFQKSLIDGIARYLESEQTLSWEINPTPITELAEDASLFYGAPPSSTDDATSSNEAMKRLVRKFDPAERDAHNRKLGRLGEELVFHSEQRRLKELGHSDLARKVRWVSEEDGDGAGFDILSFEASGEERLLEVKTTNGHQTTPFFISENERALSAERPKHFRLVRLYEFTRRPKAFQLVPPLENWVRLQPTLYRGSFASQR